VGSVEPVEEYSSLAIRFRDAVYGRFAIFLGQDNPLFSMRPFSDYPNKWAVLLAGRGGTPLKDLTRRISGHGRSKLELPDALSGRTDLGNHTRVIDTPVWHGIKTEWLRNESSCEAGYKEPTHEHIERMVEIY
jgi:hypothetical protein